MADYYELLGVSRDAAPEEIKRAYRRLARDSHPDANPDDPEAEARFKQAAAAYEVLSDPERRQRYDMFGEQGVGGGTGDPFSGVGDIFDAFFSGGSPFGGSTGPSAGPPRGSDLEAILHVGFEEAVFGAEADLDVRTAVACEVCEATGATPGSTPTRCPDCDGSGQVRRVRQSILGQMVTAGPCGRCGGAGETIDDPCEQCGGEGRRVEEKTFTVEVPAGVDTGSTLRLTGRGAVGPRGGGTGDLYVHIEVEPHDRFVRDGDDIRAVVPISPAQAALGAELDFETLDGVETITVRRGVPSGTELRLRGLGSPHVRGRGRGDLLLTLSVETPTDLTEEEDELYRKLALIRDDPVAEPSGGFVGKIKEAFK